MAVLFTVSSLAQTNDGTNSIPGIGDVAHDALPTTKEDYWKWAVAAIVPAIVLGIRKIAPSIPKGMLPIITPILGLALGYGLKRLGMTNWGWVDMTQAGALAVFVREVFHQVTTGGMSEPAGKKSLPAAIKPNYPGAI